MPSTARPVALGFSDRKSLSAAAGTWKDAARKRAATRSKLNSRRPAKFAIQLTMRNKEPELRHREAYRISPPLPQSQELAGCLVGSINRQAALKFIEMHANSEVMGALPEGTWIPRAPDAQAQALAHREGPGRGGARPDPVPGGRGPREVAASRCSTTW